MLTVKQSLPRNVLIFGGGGFIGANLAAYFLAKTDARVTLFDDLSRPGSADNIAWLRTQGSCSRLRFVRGDIRHSARVLEACRLADEIYQCAAHCGTATASDLRTDYAVTVSGTINVLEAARRSERRPLVFFTSTSKVYGTVNPIPVQRNGSRYWPIDPAFHGISEQNPLDLRSPFVSTRGTAERYICDHAADFDLPALVLRLGTIAGPRQFPAGADEWVARLVNAALSAGSVNIRGDGLQVRDVLDVADMVDAIIAARAYIDVLRGNVYNISGGLDRAISVQEMLILIERVCHQAAMVHHVPRSPEDQLLDISDCSAFSAVTGWMPRRTVDQTVRDVAASWHAAHHTPRAQPPQIAARSFREAA